MQTRTGAQIHKLTTTAILTAIVIAVSFIPIRFGTIEITLTMVPIAVGAALYGAKTGTILGCVFGIVSFLQCFGYSAFGTMLLSIDPLYTFLMCVPTRMIVGFLSGLISDALKKSNTHAATAVTSLIAPLLNTLLFTGTLILFFYNTEYIQGLVSFFGALNPFHFIVLFVGINGLVEFICGFLIAVPIITALKRALRI